MKINFSLLFHLIKTKAHQSGALPVYLRITIEGKRVEIATSRECDPSDWNARLGRAKGNKESVKSLNAYFDTLTSKVYDAHDKLLRANETLTAEKIKEAFIGKEEKPKMLIEIFHDHNAKVKALVGNEFADGTRKRYETSLRHVQNFLRHKYKKEDIDIKKIDHSFIVGLEFYLRTERKCQNNSAIKYIKNFKKIVNICLAHGWIEKNPFVNFKGKIKIVDRIYLNDEELKSLVEKDYGNDRLEQVRDIFLFCCFTGLAYADVQKLKPTEVVRGVDNELWIITKRTKTDVPSRIPLLPFAIKLLAKYRDHPESNNKGKAFPVLTNQKMNAYLKEIADIAGIKKELTFHGARHTFATTVTLANGVPIESVSKMLGHTNIKTTQHYAKILDIKVGQDMAMLTKKLIAY